MLGLQALWRRCTPTCPSARPSACLTRCTARPIPCSTWARTCSPSAACIPMMDNDLRLRRLRQEAADPAGGPDPAGRGAGRRRPSRPGGRAGAGDRGGEAQRGRWRWRRSSSARTTTRKILVRRSNGCRAPGAMVFRQYGRGGRLRRPAAGARPRAGRCRRSRSTASASSRWPPSTWVLNRSMPAWWARARRRCRWTGGRRRAATSG